MNKEIYKDGSQLLPTDPAEIQEMIRQGLETQERFYQVSETNIKACYQNYPNAFNFKGEQ